jgi:hypothetical protein
MRSLISLLLSNLIPIVIAVSIFIRIYTGIKKAVASSKKGEQPQPVVNNQRDDDGEEEPDVWERLRPDDEDEEEIVPAPPGVFTRPLLMPAAPGTQFVPSAPPVSAAPLVAAPLEAIFESTLEPDIPHPKPLAPSHELPQENFRVAAFFRNVNRLPPLQQAVIFAEILGPPKGME